MMMEPAPGSTFKRLAVFSILMLGLVVLSSLFIYKWGGAFRTVAMVQADGVYKAPSESRATAGLPFLLSLGARAVNYLVIVWPALLFGVLIGGWVRAFISPKDVRRLLGSGVVRQQLVGGIVGMPLMLCSCCIAPIFSSVQERGARLGSSLAIMFSSPSLNLAALVLTFLLFPMEIALARVAMGIFAAFFLPVVIERLAGGGPYAYASVVRAGDCPSEGAVPQSPVRVMGRWAASTGMVAFRTLPLVVLGVFASELVVGLFGRPAAPGASAGLTIALVAFFGTLIALPTFFEIPFGLLLLANGFPSGAVVAMLFAGPAINTPSLFTVARVSSRRVALLAFLGVWITAVVGGFLLEYWRM